MPQQKPPEPGMIRVAGQWVRPGPGRKGMKKARRKRALKGIVLTLAGLVGGVLVIAVAIHFAAGFLEVRKGGLNLVSLEKEWALGVALHGEFSQQLPLSDDPELTAYLQELGNSIVAHTDMADRPWRFHLVRAPVVNAFNIPGGHVYVFSGLVEQAETLDEFAGVLAHEVAHGTARHGTQILTRAYGLGELLAPKKAGGDADAVGDIAAAVLVLGYSREAEREADRLGTEYCFRAGYDPKGIVNFLKEIEEMRGDPPPAILQFLSTHPQPGERARDVQTMIDDYVTLNYLHEDTPEYQRFREKILSTIDQQPPMPRW